MITYRPGLVICFMGSLGSGKTLHMTYQAALAARRGVQCYSNYPCRVARRLMGVRDLVRVQNGLLCLDEAQSLLDSRAFAGNVNVTQWLLLIRKMGLGMFYTTQHISFVDKRLREITDLVAVQKKIMGYKGATIIELYRVDGLDAEKVGTAILRHTPLMYSLYDTKDQYVGLTLDGICKPFDEDLLSGEPSKTTRRAAAPSAAGSARSEGVPPAPPGRRV